MSTRSPASAPHVGAQQPRFLTAPAANTTAGAEAIELAETCGLTLEPWQQLVVETAFAERHDGKWSALEVALICPRQNGKGAVLEAIELAGLFMFDEELILHSAHEFKTAQEAFRRILQLVQSNSDLDARVGRVRTSHGEEGIELRNGNRLRFIARSGGSGRGFSGDRIILDEAYNLPAETMAALGPTLSARPNPQIVYTSSAPLDRSESELLKDLMRRGRQGSDRLAYLEWSADDGAALDDEHAWAQANPALGRLDPQFIREFELAAYAKDVFRRERLGIVDLRPQATSTVLDMAAWVDCEQPDSRPDDNVSFALDVAPSRQAASIAVAAESSLGGVHLEIVEARDGVSWLVERVRELHERWGGRFGIAIGSPAWALLPELRDTGAQLFEISVTAHAQACGSFVDAVNERKLNVIQNDRLADALVAAKVKHYGDSWLWARRSTDMDITPLIAITLARWTHLNPEPETLAAPIFAY